MNRENNHSRPRFSAPQSSTRRTFRRDDDRPSTARKATPLQTLSLTTSQTPPESEGPEGTPAQPAMRLFVNKDGRAEKIFKSDFVCGNASKCGSCSKLDEPYKLQLQEKTTELRERTAAFDPLFSQIKVLECVPSPETMAYRHTAKLVVNERSQPSGKRWVDLGLYKPDSHIVVDVKGCPVQTDDINSVAGYLRSAIWRNNVTVYNPRTRSGQLRYVAFKQARQSREILVTFVTATADKVHIRTLAREMSERFHLIRGVIMHVNSTSGNAIFRSSDDDESISSGESEVLLAGQSFIHDDIANLRLRYSASSFMQVNPAMAERAYNRIAELADLSPHEEVLDLYCGVGPISLLLAKRAARVVGIEESTSAIADARQNVILNDLRNVDFRAGRTEDTLQQLISDGFIHKPAVVTLNPSRRGCQPATLEAIAALRPRNVIYMSCNTGTLLRDLQKLQSLGFRTTMLEPFDMFPSTNHYEVIAHLVAAES